MAQAERQQAVQSILQNLRDLDGLKKLFWEELNYERKNQPLSPRQWPDNARNALAEDPVLFASGGVDDAFHVVYCRLASPDLKRGFERPVVSQLLREHPYALFVFSNSDRTAWHFVNVKYDEQAERRRLFRRITVRPGAGLRTATERVQLLDLAGIEPELFGIAPLAIQKRCDEAFDVEAVTKDFFREIANWYFWALKNARFPKDAPKEADGHDHISVIRLITRLIFCWFVKEKGLIPDTLFDERKLAKILAGFDPSKTSDKQSVYYRAILQNLFFATLNTEMDKRGWTKEEQNFMAHSLYRHRECFGEPKSALDLFKEIPFLNGGLFECLDKDLGENAKPRYVRIDGFSRREDSQPIVPDFLFFGDEREVDLSADYGDKKFKKVHVRGLIDTLNRYKFTIEENTPFDQEVALDPELAGKVFENLLAAYNPETGATARKQTGSFYTPREIVNYMVDEALIACLKEKLTAKPTKNAKTEEAFSSALSAFSVVEQKLRHLFAYNDELHQFIAPEVDALIAAIDGLKSLDPAVGSGAFPMGILHKLVFILGKLDPRNEKWKERQIARVRDTMATAEKIEDATARERAVRELEQQIEGINEAFAHNELDYGRKLYLIENGIYGVDIQPIAVQIAKMRFFISLIVDQKIDDAKPNRGVRPLPNLETKFVAANTLIGVNRPGQQLLRNLDIDAKEAELRRVRERHFSARTPKQKAKCRDDDARLRAEIAELLKGDGWDTTTARKLASWNPYDQNISANFFDAEWMFGIICGFAVVIGNPPYGLVGSDQVEARAYYTSGRFKLTAYKINLYLLFLERGLELLNEQSGILSFIIPKSLVFNSYFEATRRRLLDQYRIPLIVEVRNKVFETAEVGDSILFFSTAHRPTAESKLAYKVVENVSPGGQVISMQVNLQTELAASLGSRFIVSSVNMPKTQNTLGDIWEVSNGLNPGNVKHLLLSASRLTPKHKKMLLGRDIQRYALKWSGTWVNFDPSLKETIKQNETRSKKGMTAQQHVDFALRSPEIYKPHKVMVRKTADRIVACFDLDGLCFDSLSFGIQPKSKGFDPKFLLGLINSKLLGHIHAELSQNQEKVFAKVLADNLRKLPMPNLNPNLSDDRAKHDDIVTLVDNIIVEKQTNPTADTSALEREIDQKVYALYGLTPEEIKIVEESA